MRNAFGISVGSMLCPDCTAEARLVDHDGVQVLHVLHDDTCPTLARIEARR